MGNCLLASLLCHLNKDDNMSVMGTAPKWHQVVSFIADLRGNSNNFTTQSLCTGVGNYFCICEKSMK